MLFFFFIFKDYSPSFWSSIKVYGLRTITSLLDYLWLSDIYEIGRLSLNLITSLAFYNSLFFWFILLPFCFLFVITSIHIPLINGFYCFVILVSLLLQSNHHLTGYLICINYYFLAYCFFPILKVEFAVPHSIIRFVYCWG